MGKLFGTDGIRGKANIHPMTPELAVQVGRAVSHFFKNNTKGGTVLIGRDTRISGPMLEHALAAGVCAAGGKAILAGVIPTPGVAYLASHYQADAGIVISASHNPYYDNGIKVFKGNGFKLFDETESEIEKLLLAEDTGQMAPGDDQIGSIFNAASPLEKYEEFLKQGLGNLSLSGRKIVLDCANGATCQAGPSVFKALGAEVTTLFAEPDGININDECGSQHPETLVRKVLETGADAGLAFDGDGDRVIAVDEKGNIITGDRILAVCAGAMKKKGILKNNRVVTTVMSNMGLHVALKEMGIDQDTVAVGDRYVMEKMVETGAVIGGEDSGHMIFLGHHTTGDGILTGLKLMEAMIAGQKPLSELTAVMDVFPQILMNIEVTEKPDIASVPEISEIIDRVEKDLAGKGRVLVRYSGTQPLCRVMVEGPTPQETEKACVEIMDVVRRVIGT